MKELKVSAIENGSVIDHIPADSVFKVIKILNLKNYKQQITFGTNFESKKLGRKGIIKIKDKFLKNNEVNKIALFAPEATLVTIKNYEVIEKKTIQLPKHIVGFIKCVNPKCVTNNEQVEPKFDVSYGDEIKLKCRYCEKMTGQKNFQINV